MTSCRCCCFVPPRRAGGWCLETRRSLRRAHPRSPRCSSWRRPLWSPRSPRLLPQGASPRLVPQEAVAAARRAGARVGRPGASNRGWYIKFSRGAHFAAEWAWAATMILIDMAKLRLELSKDYLTPSIDFWPTRSVPKFLWPPCCSTRSIVFPETALAPIPAPISGWGAKREINVTPDSNPCSPPCGAPPFLGSARAPSVCPRLRRRRRDSSPCSGRTGCPARRAWRRRSATGTAGSACLGRRAQE